MGKGSSRPEDDTAEVTVADDASATPPAGSELVPGWLALLVLVLIVAVVGVGGYVLRGVIGGSAGERSPAKADIDKWTRAVQADPTDLDARLNLAYAYQQDEQYDVALQGYAGVLEERPKDMAALYNTGVIYMLTAQPKKGEIALWDVLEIDPTHALAAKELGEYYAAKKQYKSLLRAVGPAIEAKPSLADLQALAGLAYENLGERDKAIEHYQQALRFSPDLKRAADGLARLGGASK
ncbi:MAG TPA: tetratricopeptide repeat protein [Coriobacteriia bacterium]